ncbi:MAG TPA: HSP90 family protein [Kofleriaceae bacterium]
MSFKFQVDLGGIIALLSDHLYASPDVFVRELLQNAVDAITARGGGGHIGIAVAPGRLVFTDDGIGLSEDDVHRFLATIGESSKRGGDFLGQFGIGLLSCFVVSDEISVTTHREGFAPVLWRGRVDGTYAVDAGPADAPIGTRVELVAKRSAEGLFAPQKLVELVTRYGGLLPYPIEIAHDGGTVSPNAEPPPFRRSFKNPLLARRAALAYGKQVFGETFTDAILLRSEAGDVDGLAFVRAAATTPGGRRADRVYLKGMLLGDSAEDLVPAWAGFVRVIVDARGLRPTASREGLYHDDVLAAAQAELGACVRDHLAELPEEDLRALLDTHGVWLKAMCLEDDELCRAIIDWFPFETTLGRISLGELRRESPVVRFAPSVDAYRQLAAVAAASHVAIANAGYIYDVELLGRLPLVGARAEAVRVDDLLHELAEVELDELDAATPFLRAADAALRPFSCVAELKQFEPASLPVLYAASERAAFRRDAKRTSEAAGGLWGSVLGQVADADGAAPARLVFNHGNALVQRLLDASDRQVVHHAVRALYTQALMLGHHPLSPAELTAMNESLVGLVELATLMPRGPRGAA